VGLSPCVRELLAADRLGRKLLCAWRANFSLGIRHSLKTLREATNGGWALGDTRSKRRIAKAAGRRARSTAEGPALKRARDHRQIIQL
jgi:hypothetical protein